MLVKTGVFHLYIFPINYVRNIIIAVSRIIRMCQSKNSDPKLCLSPL